MIRPLSEQACLWAYNSNFLYPPNSIQIRVVDQGNLRATWEHLSFSPLNLEMEQSLLHRSLKPVRAVARTVYFLAVAFLIAPIGVVWHTSMSTFYFFKSKTCKLLDHKNVTANFAWKHANCISIELERSLIVAFFVYLVALTYIAGKYPDIFKNREKGSEMAFNWFGKVCLVFFPFIGSFPEYLPVLMFRDRKKCLGLYQSIQLKNLMGLTGLDGSLLTFNEQDDFDIKGKPEEISSHFVYKINARAELNYFLKVKEIKLFIDNYNIRKSKQHNLGVISGTHFKKTITTLKTILKEVQDNAEISSLEILIKELTRLDRVRKNTMRFLCGLVDVSKDVVKGPYTYGETIANEFDYMALGLR